MNNPKINSSYKVIADHLRSTSFLIADGVLPANEGRGYVLRRIMRRAMMHAHKLSSKKTPLMYKLVPVLIKEMGDAYPELVRAQDLITDTLKIEEERFAITLDRGLDILKTELAKIDKSAKQKFSGEIAFKLYDTYGFPLDLTTNILKEKNIKVDIQTFNTQMALQKKRAKQSWSGSGGVKDDNFYFNLKEKLGKSKFLGYETTKATAKIIAILKDGKELDKADMGSEIILDQTPFYAAAGGQRGDDGNIILASQYNEYNHNKHKQLKQSRQLNQLISYQKLTNILDIGETKKYADGLFIHPVTDIRGQFKVGDEIIALVNNRNRQFRAQNHSATHLLHFALKEVLGKQITQKGSNVDSSYFTFDFNHPQALKHEELKQIEDLVNFYIRQNSRVKTEILPIKEARNKGAVALFGEKYDNMVRVLSMVQGCDESDLSIEFCGGTHVHYTGNIGIFKIISEKGIAAGIRRIEAKTGYFALEHINLQEKKLLALLESLKIKQQFDEIKMPKKLFHHAKKGFDDLSYFIDEDDKQVTSQAELTLIQEAADRIYQLGAEKFQEIKQKNKEIANLKKEKIVGNSNNFTLEKVAGINLIHHFFENNDAKEVRNLITEVKNKKEYKNNSVIIFFGANQGKVSVALVISNDLTNKFNASKLMPVLVKNIGGQGGGGKTDFAMGGGNNKSGITALINNLKELILNPIYNSI